MHNRIRGFASATLLATTLNLLFIPVLYVTITSLIPGKKRAMAVAAEATHSD